MSFEAGICYFDGLHTSTKTITFDGRLDNREELQSRLGGSFPPDATDAALALAAYEKWGIDGLAHLVGDWSLAIRDGARKTVVLASDFAGVRPFYYYSDRNRVVWSTGLQSLVDGLDGADIDEDYAAGFLVNGACANRTLYRGIHSPPPGHAVSISADSTKIQQFWKLPIGETIRYRQPSEYEEQLRALFADAVRCRLRSPGPVLAELSGGLDSSSIVCMAHQLVQNGSVENRRIVTLSLEHEGSIDTPFYTAVEKFCGFESIHVDVADHPFLTEAPAGSATPGMGQRLHAHNAEIARRIGAETYLTGKLGDLVMGNLWDNSDQVAGLLRRGRAAEALRQSLAWSKLLRVPIWWVLGKAILSNLPPTLVPSAALPLTDGSNRPRAADDSVVPELRKRIEHATSGTWFGHAWKQAPPEHRTYFRGLLEILALRRLQPPEALEHLLYTHPYAHRPLVVFLSSIPAEIVCGPGEPRRLMRRAFQSILPPELHKRRSKDSFGGVYLDALRPLARMLLQETRPLEVIERGWVEPKSLKKRLELVLHSLDCNESQLCNIVLLELWLRGRNERPRWKNLSLPA